MEMLSILNSNIKGQLAAKAGHELPVRVLSSNRGYYIGTFSETLGPVSRESVEYWDKAIHAEEAMRTGKRTQRRHP